MVQQIHFLVPIKCRQYSKGMKSIAEALDLRNTLLMNFENAVATMDEEKETGC